MKSHQLPSGCGGGGGDFLSLLARLQMHDSACRLLRCDVHMLCAHAYSGVSLF